ncbi:hypothetical protein [Maribacter ulvicola]|uniref:Uncharacterized protein n=1 Tax=Maribacter ulvicola TaxID=228959 RepID=A0A1N6PAS3_9FLAO|nr:hypothetical protein [Maribacter ulvicola]SIQ01434.1 hypothetical protein SAMN05421797_101356 [Maribacter ulvicola]
MNLVTVISIIVGLGFIGLLLRNYIVENTSNDFGVEKEDAFCEIDMDHVLMYSDQSEPKDVRALKRKLQEFKNRNKFYKM